jgi:hypothetical protein
MVIALARTADYRVAPMSRRAARLRGADAHLTVGLDACASIIAITTSV